MGEYDDIINLPYQKSRRRKWMSLSDRAAQFAPFAALTGHEDAVKEVARLTDGEVLLDEYEIEKINFNLMQVKEKIDEKPRITVTYFIPDEKKEGGEYKTLSDNAVKIKEFERILVLSGGQEIFIDRIVDIVIDTSAICRF